MRLRLWWTRPKAPGISRRWRKPVALLLGGVLVPFFTAWLLSLMFPDEARGLQAAIHNLLTDPRGGRLEWREATQLILLLVGIPAAFLLWLFRDANVTGTLENQRKDVYLKEFQEMQMRAAGAMHEDFPVAARETLQIAALHQLRSFLRGEYGDSFRRPAIELLRARFAASAQVVGTQAIWDWICGWRARAELCDGDLGPLIAAMNDEVGRALAGLRADRVAATERIIVAEEWRAIFRAGIPLASSTFDVIVLRDGEVLAEIGMPHCRFIGATLTGIHFERATLHNSDFAHADLTGAHFEGADLDQARFEGAHLGGAHMERASARAAHFEGANMMSIQLPYADLSRARLDGANLRVAQLIGVNLAGASLIDADLTFARLDRANLREARLAGANLSTTDVDDVADCYDATFDGDTQLGYDWRHRSEEGREEARAAWVARGALRLE